ncbi:cache domain-containing protein [bacterium]|nr:cache domain-containing protein [bacterium]
MINKLGQSKNWIFNTVVPAILTVILFVLVSFIIVRPTLKKTILSHKKEMLTRLIETASNVLNHYHQLEANGELSVEEAQAKAVEHINFMRYGDNKQGYFYIFTLDAICKAQPFHPELVNKNLSRMHDASGKYFILEFINTVKKNKSGYVTYLWPNFDDPQRIIPKLSFVKEFEPWGWVIGTGIYIEDVNATINRFTNNFLIISTIILIIITFLSAIIIVHGLRAEKKRRQAEQSLKEREKQFRQIVEKCPFPVLITSITGKNIYGNIKLIEVFGYTLDDIPSIESFMVKVFPDKDYLDYAKSCWENDIHILRTNPDEIQSRMFNLTCKDKTVRTVIFQLIMSDNKTLYLFAEDITDRKIAEDKLIEERQQLISIFDSIALPIYVCDKETFKLVYVNEAFKKYWGDRVGEICYEVLENNTAPCSHCAVLNNNKNYGEFIEFQNKLTDKFFHVMSTSFIWSDAKHVFCNLAIDVTEHKKLENELLKIKKLESISTLAGGIAHDFNNLLTSILGNLSIAILHTKANKKVNNTLKQAEKATMAATSLSHQLLTFSKGGTPIKTTAYINDLIKHSAQFAIKGTNVKCSFKLDKKLQPVEIDSGQIHQVISNVLRNAIEAMPNGGTIKIISSNRNISEFDKSIPLEKGDYVKIEFHDEGSGINKNISEKIYDPFFTTKENSTGLGLTASYAIIKKHNGHMQFQSDPNKGTVFTIYLPASPIKEISGSEQTDIPAQKKGKILIVDDDLMILSVCKDLLLDLGYYPITAKNTKEAVDFYKKSIKEKKPFDAVIIDLVIPGEKGGKDIIKSLLKINPEIKAIASSGYSNDPILSGFEKYGFKAILSKPYSIQQLSAVLQKIITN